MRAISPRRSARLLFGLVEQLVARINLARQAAHPFLGGRAALLDLRNLLLFGGDPLFEGRDDPFLLLDAAVGLCGGGEGEEQERKGQDAERSHGRAILWVRAF